jgi:transposase
MRFVATKSEEQQSGLMLHRSRQLLVCQRTMLSNALRGHMAELGIICAKGRNGTAELLEIIAGRISSVASPADLSACFQSSWGWPNAVLTERVPSYLAAV